MKNDRLVKALLTFSGCIAILLGLGSGLYSYFILTPRLTEVSVQLTRGLTALEATTQTLENHAQLFSASMRGIHSGAQLANLFPETLISLRGTLLQSAELLQASSATTREMEQGISGIVLPDEELTASANFMRKTATQLRLMAKMVDHIQGVSSNLNTHVSDISWQLTKLGTTLGPASQLLKTARTDIQKTRNAIESLSIPNQIALASIGVGGMYIFFGLTLLAISMIYERVVQLSQLEQKTGAERRLEKAA